MKKILLTIILVTLLLNAKNFNKYDIEGTYLGQKLPSFIKTLNLKNNEYSVDKQFVPNTNIPYNYFLKINKKINKSKLNAIWFDHNKELYMINKWRKYDNKPNWNQIKKKIISKYGQPNIVNTTYYNGRKRVGLCWGQCKRVDFSDGSVKCKDKQVCMRIIYYDNFNGEGVSVINQEAVDGHRDFLNSVFYNKQKKLHAESDF